MYMNVSALAHVRDLVENARKFGGDSYIAAMVIVRALVVLSLSAFGTAAEAQQPVIGHAAAVPHFSAPAPRFSPIAPSVAPRFVAPRLTGPRAIAPTLSEPHLPPPGAMRSQIYTPQIMTLRQNRRLKPNRSRAVTHDFSRNAVQIRYSRPTALNKALTLRNPVFADSMLGNREDRPMARSVFRGNFSNSDLGKKRDRHHHRSPFIVLGFVGPLFWPYAFNDLIDFTFWPYAYDTFWPRAYDDVFTGIYGGYAPQYYVPDYGTRTRDESEICLGQAETFIHFPIERIARQVAPSEQQKTLLDEMKTATAKAVSILQNACPTELSSTPPGRLAAMRTRVEAMLQAVEVVRPALEKLYQSLTDEQKERFNIINQDIEAVHQRRLGTERSCSGVLEGNEKLPLEQVKTRLQLSSDQESRFKELAEASAKAANILNARCRPTEAFTPTAHLAAMADRLDGVLQALKTLEDPLERFYQSLDDEQKARFNRLGPISRKFGSDQIEPKAVPSICRC
jgi:hypothetical protein